MRKRPYMDISRQELFDQGSQRVEENPSNNNHSPYTVIKVRSKANSDK